MWNRWLRCRKLRMVWRVEKGTRLSFLVGTAHFFPCSFARSLKKLIRESEFILFEGPLDRESMSRVERHGRNTDGLPSLCEAIDPSVIEEIRKHLSHAFVPHRSAESYLELFQARSGDFLETHVHGTRPWMGFFALWSVFLGWSGSIDRDAFQIASRMKKRIYFLETVEEQLAALDGIPFQRFVDYINRFSHWKYYKDRLFELFTDGNLDQLMSTTHEFPTRCDSVLGLRDARLVDRMKPFLENGKTATFVGISHVPGMKNLLLKDGYSLIQIAI